ncbi:hypothetical protein HW49_11265 [Porphyromonadaceae bacterium COT-184 OH4590]|nr:hypothetical protein HW49_11265 [Porphyromonadaceae bacterium COT-184 OH4590]
MNFLAEHIEKLLISNDCVVVSSLGGFIKNRKTAAIMGNRIVPPMVEISFNSMLRHDDGLLCSLIAEENDISYKSALALMNRYIEEFRQRLINEKNVVFGNIGLFTYVDDTVIFTPYEANYLPENFGLAPIEVEERRRVQKIGETIEFDNDSITINITEIKQKVVRYAAMVAVVMLVAIFVPKASKTTQYAGFMVNKNDISVEKKRLASDKALADFAKTIDKPLPQTNEPIADAKPQVEQSRNYHLVVASFYQMNQAEEFCAENQDKFGNISILKSNDTPAKYRCITGSYTSEQEANASKTEANRASWVLFQRQ